MQLNKKAEVVCGKKQIYTELVVAAHQDDIEIMCPQAIIKGEGSSLEIVLPDEMQRRLGQSFTAANL